MAAFLNTANVVDASSPQLASPAAGEGRNERHAAFTNANTAIEGADPDALYLLSSTSEAYSWLIKLLSRCRRRGAGTQTRAIRLLSRLHGLNALTRSNTSCKFDGSWFIDIDELEWLRQPGR